MSVIRNLLGAEFLFTPPEFWSARSGVSAAVPAIIRNMLRRLIPEFGFAMVISLRPR
jgi:hypothetical protein